MCLQFARIWIRIRVRAVYIWIPNILFYNGGCHTRRGQARTRAGIELSEKRRHRANRTTGVHQLNEPFSNCSADDDDDDGSAGSWHFYLYLLPGPPTRSLALPSSPTLRAARHVSRSPADCRLRLYGSTALWEYGSSADRQKCQGRRQT